MWDSKQPPGSALTLWERGVSPLLSGNNRLVRFRIGVFGPTKAGKSTLICNLNWVLKRFRSARQTAAFDESAATKERNAETQTKTMNKIPCDPCPIDLYDSAGLLNGALSDQAKQEIIYATEGRLSGREMTYAGRYFWDVPSPKADCVLHAVLVVYNVCTDVCGDWSFLSGRVPSYNVLVVLTHVDEVEIRALQNMTQRIVALTRVNPSADASEAARVAWINANRQQRAEQWAALSAEQRVAVLLSECKCGGNDCLQSCYHNALDEANAHNTWDKAVQLCLERRVRRLRRTLGVGDFSVVPLRCYAARDGAPPVVDEATDKQLLGIVETLINRANIFMARDT